ncbi:hypothetical protein [Lederbergia citrea]|uniref:Uncharacterized protein n=1 Tax=Lederbergia citrea TaxID=2833581 RepID=A0A942Z5U7_9BACI|nr:hypothetical protein [Lederbergia citrea]MBS4223321.1 hypothetical protein [Lederbergia citrea]
MKNKIYEIPISKIKNGKMMKSELADQTVLMMEMIYETENRKPFRISRLNFQRVSFDTKGIYDVKAEAASEEFRIKLSFIFNDIVSEQLPIPIAPCIPSNKEIQVLELYLNNKYPSLLINTPHAIKNLILRSIEIHKEEIEKMKKSHKASR